MPDCLKTGGKMNQKIEKMKAELQRNMEKISRLTDRNMYLKAKITELENLEIIGIVRDRQISPAELEAAFGIKAKEDEASDDFTTGDEADE